MPLLVGGRSLPMFHVPTNTEITSGSLCCECLIFISWSRWQKASRFWRMEMIPWEAGRVRMIPFKDKAFSPVHSRTSSPVACCDGCRWPCVFCSGAWQSEGLKPNKHQQEPHLHEIWREKRFALLLSCEILSTPNDTAFLSKSSTPESTSTETVCLPYLSTFTWTGKKKKKVFHTVKDESFLCSYAALLLQFTWKELTGKGLAGVLTGVAFGGIGSGGGGFCCTARLWLVIASCKAFNTCKVRKNIN